MKGIMRKRLLALLSAAGLAGSAVSSAQAVQGSDPGAKAQTESTAKDQKRKQENKAGTDIIAVKSRKADGEQQAQKDVVSEKLGPDHIVHKHIAGVKYDKSRKANMDASSKDAAKMTKSANENAAAHTSGHIKGEKAAASTNAAQNEANKKASQAPPK